MLRQKYIKTVSQKECMMYCTTSLWVKISPFIRNINANFISFLFLSPKLTNSSGVLSVFQLLTSKGCSRLLKCLQHPTRCTKLVGHFIKRDLLHQILQGHGGIKPLMNCQLLCLPAYLLALCSTGSWRYTRYKWRTISRQLNTTLGPVIFTRKKARILP